MGKPCTNCIDATTFKKDAECFTIESDNVIYTGPPLPCSNVQTHDNFTEALQKLDAIICTLGAPQDLQSVLVTGNIATDIGAKFVSTVTPLVYTEILNDQVTSGAFIKIGGLSTEYLMADGSISTTATIVADIIAQTIIDGDITHAPSGNAVFDALTSVYSAIALKADDALVIHNFGNETKTGSLTVNSIIRAGGLATQFLKADGSIDSTTYQPILTNPITGTGTVNRLPKFGTPTGLVDSNISDTGILISLLTNTSVTGNITATSFIKTGGLVTQFLKADGSVDSNTYALDANVLHTSGNETFSGRKTGTNGAGKQLFLLGNNGVVESGTTAANATPAFYGYTNNAQPVYTAVELIGGTGDYFQAIGTDANIKYRIDYLGNVILGTPPTTSAGTFDILTRNTVSGVVEKIASTAVISGSGTLNTVPKFTPNGTTLGNSSIIDSGTLVSIANPIIVNGTSNAAAGVSRGQYINTTNVATANNDVLVGLDVNPVFNQGAFTGVSNFSARLAGDLLLLGNINPNLDNVRSIGTPTFNFGNIFTRNVTATTGNLGIGTSFANADVTIYAGGGSVKQRIFGTTGNTVFQNGGAFVDNGYRVDIQGTTRLFSTVTLGTLPSTSAGGYDLLTRNTGTGVIEKIANTATNTAATPHVDYLVAATVQGQLDNTETTVVSLAKVDKTNFKDIYQTGRVRIDTDASVLTISPANTLNITLVDDILFVNEIVINTNANKLADFLLSFGTRVFVASGANTPLAANTRGVFYLGINKLGTPVYQLAKVYDQDVCYLARVIVENLAGVYTIISFKYFPDLANNRVNNRDRTVLSSGYIVPSGAASISFGNRGVTFGKNSINYSNNKFDPNFLSVVDSVNPAPMQFLFALPNLTSLATSIALSTVINPTQWYLASGAVGGGAVVGANYQVYRLMVTVTGTIVIQTKASTSNAPAPGVNAIFANRDDALAGLTSTVFPDILPIGDSIPLGTFYLRAGTAANGSQLNDPNDFYFRPFVATSSSSTVGVTDHDLLSNKNVNPAFQHVTTGDIANWNVAYNNRITALTTTGSSGASTLIANTLNIPNYTLAGLGGVSGSGSSGQVSFWNGTTSQSGDNGLFWDNTNKRLGIGITVPVFHLDITGPDGSGVRYKGASGVETIIGGSSTLGQVGTTSAHPLLFLVGSVERARIDTSGNFLIGTTSDNTNKLQVNGSGSFNGNISIFGTTDTRLFQATNDDGILYVGRDNSTGSNFGTPYANLIWGSSNRALIFATNNTQRMTLLGNGNLGVNNTNPQGVLHAGGKIIFSSQGNTNPVLGSTAGNFNLNAGNYGTAYGLQIGFYNTGGTWMQAQTDDGSTIAYPIILNPLGGNIGIGTTSPSVPLHVASIGNPNIILQALGSGTQAVPLNRKLIFSNYLNAEAGSINVFDYNQDTARTQMAFNLTNTAGSLFEVMRINYDGALGVGTVNPAERITSLGNIVSKTASLVTDGDIGKIGFGPEGYNTMSSYIKSNFRGPNWYRGSDLSFFTSDSADITANTAIERMRIAANGNVGIGTTNPTSLLSLQTVSTITGDPQTLSLYEDSAAKYGLTVNGTSGGMDFCANQSAAATSFRWYGGADKTTPKFLMSLKGTGDLGIGTSTPVTRLNVDKPSQTIGAATPNGSFLLTDGSNTSYSLEMGIHVGSGPWIQSRSFFDATMYPLAINPSGGNVSIGTTSGSYKFNVLGTSFLYGGAGTGLIVKGGDTGVGTIIFQAQDLNGVEVARIDGTGAFFMAKALTVGGRGLFNGGVDSRVHASFSGATGNSYDAAALEVQGNAAANTIFPTIGFHQPSLYAFSLSARNGGFYFMDISGVNPATVNCGTINASGTVTASGGFFTSDARLKDVIRRDGDVAYFKWKDGRDDKEHVGYIAQEVQGSKPDQVQEDKEGMLTVNYIEILVEKIRILEKEIEALKNR